MTIRVYVDRDGHFRCTMCAARLVGYPGHECDEAIHPLREHFATFPRIAAKSYADGSAAQIVRRWAEMIRVPLGFCVQCQKRLEVTAHTPAESLLMCFACRREWNGMHTERLRNSILVQPDQLLVDAIASKQREREDLHAIR